jgi:hypothetical protein
MTDSSGNDDEAQATWPGDPGQPQPQAPGEPGAGPETASTAGTDPYWASSASPDPNAPLPADAPSDTVELGATSPAPRTGRTRILVAAAAGVAVLAVIGIVVGVTSGGSSGPQGSPAQVLTAAVHNADAITSATATYSEHVSGPSAASVSTSGTVTEIRVPLQMSMHITETVGSEVLPMSGILTGDSIYIKFGAASGLPASMIGKWLEIKYSEIPGGNAIGSVLQSMSSENPSLQLQPLLAGRNVRAVGSQDIAGVPTTEYKGSFTESAALKALPASVRSQLGPALKDLTGVAHFTVWIDGQDQVRRLAEQETVGTENVNIEITFLSYNQPVTITTPPASQVVPVPAGALGGS